MSKSLRNQLAELLDCPPTNKQILAHVRMLLDIDYAGDLPLPCEDDTTLGALLGEEAVARYISAHSDQDRARKFFAHFLQQTDLLPVDGFAAHSYNVGQGARNEAT